MKCFSRINFLKYRYILSIHLYSTVVSSPMLKPVLGIPDILVRIRIRRSVPLWLTDPDLTPFFSDFRMQKKVIFSYFSLQLARGHIIFILKIVIFLLKFCVKNLFCKHYFSPLNTFMRKGKDPDADVL